jgi:GNAT superfamily N-acetyltransferase
MWWRLSRSEFMKQRGDGNKKALKKIVDFGQVPGILAYSSNEPVGWCSVGPRESFPTLERSRVLKRVDDKPVWSIVCFYVDKRFRRRGLTVALARAAINYAKARGAQIVEGYSVKARAGKMPDPFAYTGLVSSLRDAGFVEIAKPSETRLIMRYEVSRSAPRL